MISTKKLIYNVIQRFSKVDYYGAITGYAPADVSIASETSWHELCEFTLPKGVWLVSFAAQFPNATGTRAVTLATEWQNTT